MVNPVVIRRCVARSSMNCWEQVTGGTSLCTMKQSTLPPRTRVPSPRWSATNKRRWSSRARGSWPRRAGREGDQNRSTQSTTTALTPRKTPSTNARIPRVQYWGRHLRGRRLECPPSSSHPENPATVRGSLRCGRRSRTNCSTRVTATRRRSPSCARPAPRDSSWRSPCRNPL